MARSEVVVSLEGTWRNTMDVAVKKLTPGEMSKDSFVDEARLLHRLRHRHLVLLLGVCTVAEPIYIIMELLSNGSLHQYLRSDLGRSLCFSILIAFSTQVRLTPVCIVRPFVCRSVCHPGSQYSVRVIA